MHEIGQEQRLFQSGNYLMHCTTTKMNTVVFSVAKFISVAIFIREWSLLIASWDLEQHHIL